MVVGIRRAAGGFLFLRVWSLVPGCHAPFRIQPSVEGFALPGSRFFGDVGSPYFEGTATEDYRNKRKTGCIL